jgi:N6-L-threonylcarbamoyladenine synthase
MMKETEVVTRILAIETSCDETAAAVVESGTRILSNVIASQTDLHAQYGGVFPEVASRKHIEVIHAVVAQAMGQAYLGYDDLDCIAVTKGPGLVGSLLVGVNVAKGLALARNKPLLGVNHIEGHIYSIWLTEAAPEIRFPLLTLVVSGGHTELYLMRDHLDYEHLGGTIDDAAGEAFDKVGRLLGPALPRRAGHRPAPRGKASRPPSTVPARAHGRFLRLQLQRAEDGGPARVERYDSGPAAGGRPGGEFPGCRRRRARRKDRPRPPRLTTSTAVHLTGGVSANSALRAGDGRALDIPVRYPPLVLCTDNAAMIAAAAHWHFLRGQRSGLDLEVAPSLQLL